MKAMLRNITVGNNQYPVLMFVCPGCIAMDGSSGLHNLPVNTILKTPSWDWDGNLEQPTLNPSILTRTGKGQNICHSYFRNGIFEYLDDCTHQLAGKSMEMADLPEWVLDE